jgi:four helix bundle protein
MALVYYEDMEVYKLAFNKAIELHKLSQGFPKTEQYGGLADQVRRSSKSICANLAEGLSKQMSIADKKKYTQIALGSAEETRVWLAFAIEFGWLSAQLGDNLREDYKRITQMLYKLQNNITF